MYYNDRGYALARAWHEGAGHCLVAQKLGLSVTGASIIPQGNSGGRCTIPDLHRAPLFDQITVLRAGVVASRLGGYPYHEGGIGGDFVDIDRVLTAAGHTYSDDFNAIVARADRRAEKIIRENWDEAQRLVARLVAERTITFEQSKPAPAVRAVTSAPKPAGAIVPTKQIRTATMPLLVRSTATSTSFNAAKNTLDVCFTTGEPVVRFDLNGERYLEVLETGAHNVDLSRLNSGAPFLNSHRADSLDAVLGSVVSARMEGGKGLATVKLSTRKEVAGVVMDLADGIITGISTGYKYVTTVREKDRDNTPVWRVTKWQPYELSACLIQADSGARVRNGTSHEFHVVG